MQYLKPIVVPNAPDLDIVFVHGLNPKGADNHARQTWTDDGDVFWPQTLLPQELPTARILLFAYNSSIFSNASNANVASHARTLCDRLKNRRLSEHALHRPLVFVAHSLGGLLVKQALVEAKDNPLYKCLKASTYGLVFFATPHCGGEKAGVAEAAANVCSAFTGQPKNKLLDSLKANSLINGLSSDLFKHQLDHYDIFSFIERRKMPLKIVPWLPTRNMKYIVNASSAKLGCAKETYLDVDRNHSNICKFSGLDDHAYEGVGPNLKAMGNKARQHLVRCEHAEPDQYDLIEDMHNEWQNSTQRRIALTGIGGVGKSELSNSFIERLDSKRYVLWLRARNYRVLQQNLTDAARDLRNELLRFSTSNKSANGEENRSSASYFAPVPVTELVDILKQWLKAVPADGSRILVILDDLDGLESSYHEEYSMVFTGDALDLIYTSRDPTLSDPGMLWEASHFNVPPLPVDRAVEIIEHHANKSFSRRKQSNNAPAQNATSPGPNDQNAAPLEDIATRLGGLPAAITMGAQYMTDILGAKWDPQGYQKFLERWDHDDGRINILQTRRPTLTYRHSILASVEVSLQRLQRNLRNDKKSIALEKLSLLLLWLFSFMDLDKMTRHELSLFKNTLRALWPDLLDLVHSVPGFSNVATAHGRLTHTVSIDQCIAELIRVSLLTERADDGALLLNSVVKACVLLVPIRLSSDQRKAVEGLVNVIRNHQNGAESTRNLEPTVESVEVTSSRLERN
ncbi:MAG: hypothetical protein Q9225_007083 [Loekoesia sp. 1 TL-2023]